MTENEIRINETTMWREWITVRGLEPITLQDIDDRLAELKQQVKVEPEVKVNFAGVKKEFEDKFRHLDDDHKKVYSAYSIIDLWKWFEQKLKEASKISA